VELWGYSVYIHADINIYIYIYIYIHTHRNTDKFVIHVPGVRGAPNKNERQLLVNTVLCAAEKRQLLVIPKTLSPPN